ncbi:MAG: hypothetical protein ACRD0Q_06125 [Acidimicrobiales bacterium]
MAALSGVTAGSFGTVVVAPAAGELGRRLAFGPLPDVYLKAAKTPADSTSTTKTATSTTPAGRRVKGVDGEGSKGFVGGDGVHNRNAAPRAPIRHGF